MKIGLLRKCGLRGAIFNDDRIVINSFYSFLVWMSAAPSHISLLDYSFSLIEFGLPNLISSSSVNIGKLKALCLLTWCVKGTVYENDIWYDLYYWSPGFHK